MPRRLAAMLYEGLVVAALLLGAAALYVGILTGLRAALDEPSLGPPLEGAARAGLQAFLVAVLTTYFVWCWSRGRQTLPMKTWRLRVVAADGSALGAGRALFRFLLAAATVCTALGGIAIIWRQPTGWLGWAAVVPAALSIAWGFVDGLGRFPYDVASGTVLVRVSEPDGATRAGGPPASASPGA